MTFQELVVATRSRVAGLNEAVVNGPACAQEHAWAAFRQAGGRRTWWAPLITAAAGAVAGGVDAAEVAEFLRDLATRAEGPEVADEAAVGAAAKAAKAARAKAAKAEPGYPGAVYAATYRAEMLSAARRREGEAAEIRRLARRA